MCKNFCKYICKNICKKMCKMCKNCVNIFFPLCKIFAKFLHFSNLHSDFRPREESVSNTNIYTPSAEHFKNSPNSKKRDVCINKFEFECGYRNFLLDYLLQKEIDGIFGVACTEVESNFSIFWCLLFVFKSFLLHTYVHQCFIFIFIIVVHCTCTKRKYRLVKIHTLVLQL